MKFLIALRFGAIVSKTCFLIFTALVCQNLYAENGQQLFEQSQNDIYQIRLLEYNSENKSIIGSGFQVSDDGLIATNYHVVAEAVQTPEKYRIEYIDHEGHKGDLTLVDIDVVHDLALVKRMQPPASHITLNTTPLSKGYPIYSIGNPRDLGMTIVGGSYSGYVQNTYYGNLLFSGSLNPGMSGGPAINDKGEVIGINVATDTGGQQLSFLVPVRYLKELIDKKHPADNQWKNYIQEQLLISQEDRVTKLLNNTWHSHTMGSAQIPAEIAEFISCWGDSNNEDKDKRFDQITTTCRMNENLTIKEGFSTGSVWYEFTLLKSIDLNRFQFYSLVSKKYHEMTSYSLLEKTNAEKYICNTDFVSQKNNDFKVTMCARRYKDYPQLYNIIFTSANLNSNQEVLVSQFVLTGVTQNSGLQFAKRFMEGVSWISSSK